MLERRRTSVPSLRLRGVVPRSRVGAGRRTLAGPTVAAGVIALAMVALSTSGPAAKPVAYAERALRSQTAVLTPGGTVSVGPATALERFVGTNVLLTEEGAATHQASVLLASAQRGWVAEGTVPGPARYEDMARQALLDLDTLLLDGGALLAAPIGAWRYTWPRDASFAAVALSRTGHPVQAADVLMFLAQVQEPDGTFQARYLPDGSGDVPDDRGTQLDGDGWFLWAAAEWYAQAPAGRAREATLAELLPALTGALDAIDAVTDPVTGLPDPSPDYWEVREDSVTLGSISALLLGVRSAQELAADVATSAPSSGTGASSWSRDMTRRGARLERLIDGAVQTAFAPDGYPRRAEGEERDAAVAFLLPPFADGSAEVAAAWEGAAVGMLRPAGGLAPGEGWKQDGISWTPQTALFALTAAASGDAVRAEEWLDWLDAHRTAAGSLPEKVLWDGRPAAVAPLAWTAALVLLALAELDDAAAQAAATSPFVVPALNGVRVAGAGAGVVRVAG
ncbi:glycoside hydrolase family 15 [Cellulomonas sp. P22]|uniref:glycoside hydrolase family 15 n=1 Tax=Cellulomonas sp. P22 TaxID=3373189 RepID=UPI003799B7CE